MKTAIHDFWVYLVLFATALTPAVSAQTAAGSTTEATRLRDITVEGSDTHATVTLTFEGDPVMLAGKIQEISQPPFRLFLDLPNVVPDVDAVTPVSQGGLDRVRVALNQSSPPVTRVVLDLSRRSAFRLDEGGPDNTMRIVVGTPDADVRDVPVTEFQPSVPDSQTPGTKPKVSEEILEYASWFEQSALDLDQLLDRPVLEAASDRGGDQLSRWQSMQREVAAVTPPSSLQVAHDLLATAASLGGLAARNVDSGGAAESEAATAGARLFVTRARRIVKANLSGTAKARTEP